MDSVNVSLSSELLSKIFSQLIQSARAHFVIEEDIGSLVEKLTLFGQYSDVVAISELLQEFSFDAKEDELHRQKSLDLYIQLIEKIGIPLAYNVFTDRFINWHKRYRHLSSSTFEKFLISTLNKLCIDIEPQVLRTVFPYFNAFYQSIEDDPKYLNILECKVIRGSPANNLENYFCQMCKLIHTFKSEEITLDEQFLNNLVSKLKVDLEVNKHFINYKFRWRVHREFLWHLNMRLTNILANHTSRNKFKAIGGSIERILNQEEFSVDEVLPRETNQLKYFELLPNQYRLSRFQKSKIWDSLVKMSVESKGVLLGCVQNNTVQGIVLNVDQREILHKDIIRTIDYLGSPAFKEAIAVTFPEVRGVSVFSFEKTNRFLVKIVFSPKEPGQVFSFKLRESKLNADLLKKSFSCHWNPNWEIDESKVLDVIEKNKEKIQPVPQKSEEKVFHENSHDEKSDFYEKSTLNTATPLKQLSLTSHSSEKSVEQESEKTNGRYESEDKKTEVTNAWVYKIPTKRSSGQTPVVSG